jgi:hypothetical protein
MNTQLTQDELQKLSILVSRERDHQIDVKRRWNDPKTFAILTPKAQKDSLEREAAAQRRIDELNELHSRINQVRGAMALAAQAPASDDGPALLDATMDQVLDEVATRLDNQLISYGGNGDAVHHGERAKAKLRELGQAVSCALYSATGRAVRSINEVPAKERLGVAQ